LLAAARAAGADVPSDTVWPRIVDELLKQFVRPYLMQPTFLLDYPVAFDQVSSRMPSRSLSLARSPGLPCSLFTQHHRSTSLADF
jgi:hypothetical protein